jgi:hypothetical protein
MENLCRRQQRALSIIVELNNVAMKTQRVAFVFPTNTSPVIDVKYWTRCHEHATMRSFEYCCLRKIYYLLGYSNSLIPFYWKRAILWLTYDAGKDKTYSVLYVKCLILLSDCNKIWILSIEFDTSPQYQTSRKSVQREPNSYTWRRTNTKLIRVFLTAYAKAPKHRPTKVRAGFI